MSGLLPSWPWLITGALSGFVAYCNLPSAWILPAQRATAAYLATAPLNRIDSGVLTARVKTASELWKDHGKEIVANEQ